MIAVAYANVGFALTDPKPLEKDDKQFQAWKTWNIVCLMTLKGAIPEVYQGELENKDLTAKEFMEKIDKNFSMDKVVETRELFTKLSSMKYKVRGQVREHIYQMNTVAAELGQLGLEVINNLLMEFVLKSLPPRFNHFQLTYSIQEHKWSLD